MKYFNLLKKYKSKSISEKVPLTKIFQLNCLWLFFVILAAGSLGVEGGQGGSSCPGISAVFVRVWGAKYPRNATASWTVRPLDIPRKTQLKSYDVKHTQWFGRIAWSKLIGFLALAVSISKHHCWLRITWEYVRVQTFLKPN